MGVAAAAWLACADASADIVRIPAVPVNLTSDSERMIAYRSQERMWQTSDGVTHVLINRGQVSEGHSLALYASPDGGATWDGPMVSIPGSVAASSSDGYLSGDRLTLTFDDLHGVIRHAALDYDSTSRSWNLGEVQTVLESPLGKAVAPSMAQDGLGRVWLAFTFKDNTTGHFSIRVMLKRPRESSAVDSGLVFAADGSEANERCARPVQTANGIGIVYSLHEELHWVERNDFWPLEAAWFGRRIGAKDKPTPDPFGCHFSVTTDADGHLHIAWVDNGAVRHSRHRPTDVGWVTRTLTGNIRANYVQAVATGGALMIVSNTYSHAAAYQSIDGGDTFTRTHTLLHASPDEHTAYNWPRLEAPGRSSSPVPVLQQFVDRGMQRLMWFPVPAASSPQSTSRRR